MAALKHYGEWVLLTVPATRPALAGGTRHCNHNEAVSSRAELSKQIPPVKGLTSFLLYYQTLLFTSHISTWSLHHASRERWPYCKWKAPVAHADYSGSWRALALVGSLASVSQDWKTTWILLRKDLKGPLRGLRWCHYCKPSTQSGWQNSKVVLTLNCRSTADTKLGWSDFASTGELCPHTTLCRS